MTRPSQEDTLPDDGVGRDEGEVRLEAPVHHGMVQVLLETRCFRATGAWLEQQISARQATQ
jgi:hypothetical protein